MITWDGRLDNREELIGELREGVTGNFTDVAIVSAAYEKWSTNCFARLIGDWALSIWNPMNHSLILTKDPIGTRHLYYLIDQDHITWSTILDPLIWFSGKTFALNEEYLAGWLAHFPAPHLTPYCGIQSVPPSSSVILRPGKHTVTKYWDFDSEKRIRYGTDAEYEEHFRTVFAKAVQRRLRSDEPILAELSGGRDSTSIVCMADTIIAHGAAETSRLDTISCYDDSEPNWNERPYFTKVEEKRGRSGWHIDVGTEKMTKELETGGLKDQFRLTPSTDGRTSPQMKMCLVSQRNRVVLSGIGGDEIMGGVPIPTPQLEDLLVESTIRRTGSPTETLGTGKTKAWFYLFWETVRAFLPPEFVGVPTHRRPVSWLQSRFVKRHRTALTGYPSRVRLFGPLPTFQENISTINSLRRQLALTALPFEPPFEKRYPYLDRSLLEFMFAIPREQLVRPNQRRSLMRRALVGIVPDEILNRRTKAFASRAPLVGIARDWTNLVAMAQDMVCSSLGMVDSKCFANVLQKARLGEQVPMVGLRRTIFLEHWLVSISPLLARGSDTRVGPELNLHGSARSL